MLHGKMSFVLRAGRDKTHPSIALPAWVCSKPAAHVSGTEHITLPVTKTLNKYKLKLYWVKGCVRPNSLHFGIKV